MKTKQAVLNGNAGDAAKLAELAAIKPNLVLVFGSVELMLEESLLKSLELAFPEAQRVGCTTAGEITSNEVLDRSVVITALRFEKVRFNVVTSRLEGMALSHQAGEDIGTKLAADDLAAVLMFSPGLNVNGTALVEGVTARVASTVSISGGLAGDDGAFQKTYTLSNAGLFADQVVAIGFARDGLQVAHGCFGGWQAFGPLRRVTRSVNNVLYELDGEPALAIYKTYLGEYAKDLPSSGLLFPFEMMESETQSSNMLRTILGIDEQEGSLTLAGAIEQGGYLRLMHSQTDRLVDGAAQAATTSTLIGNATEGESIAILVSCVGRKLVMGGRVDEEVEAVADVLGRNTALAGFYSYGEISPVSGQHCAKLHNQTMTITTIGEAP